MKKTENPPAQIGIMTYYRNGSYGAALQAYALQTYLKQIGYVSKLIRYAHQWPPPLTVSAFLRTRSPSSLYNKLLSLLHRRFTDRFADEFIDETDCYNTKASLTMGVSGFKVLICGSDQIWNPWVYEQSNFFDDNYFLSFAPDSCAKISYAASFGRAELSENYKQEIKPLLAQFNSISVREASGVRLLAGMGIDAEQVLDPSFLLGKEAFLNIAEVREKHCRGILVFILGSERSVCLHVAERLSKISGEQCNVISPALTDLWKTWVTPCFPTVNQWLGMFSEASFVFTDSFHGTVFSIVFNKPFVLLLRDGGRKGRNSRLISLLTDLGLENRMIDKYDAEVIDRLHNEKIEWEPVMNKLDGFTLKSRSYLKKSLERLV